MRRSISPGRRGVALLVMLVCVALLSAGMVAFLTVLSSSTVDSQRYADRAAANVLATSVADLVIARLRAAIPSEPNRTWSSQPGLIRVYDEHGPVSVHRLYSSRQPEVSGGYKVSLELAGEVPVDWKTRRAVFTDLNAAMGVGSERHYPILATNAPGSVPGLSVDAARGVAMPVRWLYVLADGTMTTGSPSGDGTEVAIQEATDANPIVGRVAWWADDATCRVNVNTAAGGDPWMSPRTASAGDVARARAQPRTGEYQRHAGHPAVTSLASVFPGMGPTQMETLYDILPHVGPGGSQGGTVSLDLSFAPSPGEVYWGRRFANLSDFQFLADEQNLSAIDTELAGFCLTTQGRAPETTLWGTPRMMLRPVHALPAFRDAIQDQTAYAGSLLCDALTHLYWFRSAPRSLSDDFLTYQSNQLLYNYLSALTARPLPGLGGGSLEAKYGAAERDALLAAMCDLVRCTDLTGGDDAQGQANANTYTAPGNSSELGRGMVLPMQVAAGARGQGRWPLVSEVALHFVATDTNSFGAVTNMSAALILEMASPAQGHDFLRPQLVHAVTNTAPFIVNGTHTNTFAAINHIPRNVPATPAPTWAKQPGAGPRVGGSMGIGQAIWAKQTVTTTASDYYPFVWKNIPVSSSHFSFGGGTVEITIADGGQWVQQMEVAFPAVAQLPVPTSLGGTSKYNGSIPPTTNVFYFTGDTVRTMELATDWRVAAGRSVLTSAFFEPGGGVTNYASTNALSGSLSMGDGTFYDGFRGGALAADEVYADGARPDLPATINGVTMNDGQAGDWDTGIGPRPDGAYHGKPDGGTTRWNETVNRTAPYFHDSETVATSLKSLPRMASRALPSAVAFGSLPAGVVRNRPWETLLFCPNPASGASHPGFSPTPDHAWLDLFFQPVLEPRQLGDAFATEGKANLNVEIAPFSYLRRDTALRAALTPVSITAIPNGASDSYKDPARAASEYRLAVDIDATLAQVWKRLEQGAAFISAGEVCELFLVPEGAGDASGMPSWWAGYRLTGDNLREAPYAELLPRLTTRSDTYLAYYCVQRLHQPPSQPPSTWREDSGVVLAEIRGVTGIERRLSAQDARLKDWDPATQRLDPLYDWHVFGRREFQP